MIKIYFLLLLIITNIAYSQSIDPILNPYFEDLSSDKEYIENKQFYQEKIKDYIFKVVDDSEIVKMGENAVGGCLQEFKMIIFGKSFINNSNKETIQEVFDHEFGHCLLGRIHNDRIIPFNEFYINKSVMNSFIHISKDKENQILAEAELKTNKYKNIELKRMYRKELFNIQYFNQFSRIEEYKKSHKFKKMSKRKKELNLLNFERNLLFE